MKLGSTDRFPFSKINYRRVKSFGRGIEVAELAFYWAHLDQMPLGLSACIVTSDLQGMDEPPGRARAAGRQLGLVVAEKCVDLLRENGIDPKRTGCILAGDFHSDPTLSARGGHGDVRDVWDSFRQKFRWCVGVAGNHDVFGDKKELQTFRSTPGLHLLHGESVVLDDIRFGGVCGVMGSNDKPWRNSPDEHLRLLKSALQSSPKVLVLHEGPSIHEKGLDGSDALRMHLESFRSCLVICGHKHWKHNEIQTLTNQSQVLNVDGKVIVLRKKPPELRRK